MSVKDPSSWAVNNGDSILRKASQAQDTRVAQSTRVAQTILLFCILIVEIAKGLLVGA